MKVELRVGAASVSCETDHRPDPSEKCSENDAARQALFEKLLNVAIAQMEKWLYDNDKPAGMQKPPADDYVRTLEKALEPVLAVEGAIEHAKRTDRKITCREDERLFQSLDAVAEAQKVMLPVIAIEQAAAEVKAKMAEAIK